MSNIIIIGAGAAGMMAACAAAKAGAQVTVLEKNDKPGRKLYITGKGRCNVTNNCTMEEFLQEVPRNPRFLYGALTAFSPADMIAFLEENGCPVKTERGRRVFPVSDHASDITAALQRAMNRLGVEVRTGRAVDALLTEDGHVTGVKLSNGRTVPGDSVIIASGGCSYPATGSTGDGLRMAGEVGITLTPLRPSLVPLLHGAVWEESLSGLTLKNVTLKVQKGKKTLYSCLGECSFLPNRLSGPLMIEASAHLDDPTQCELWLDLKPALSEEQLDARILREMQSHAVMGEVLRTLLPVQLLVSFARQAGITLAMACAQITKETRRKIVDTLKHFSLPFDGLGTMEEAIVTRGGVNVKEINPATMECKKISGLYFAGEVLDVDAHTGGYNLQIAFSTGFLAGRSAAQCGETGA